MTPREKLIQAIERSPDEVVGALLKLLQVLQPQWIQTVDQPERSKNSFDSERLYRENGVLVIETESLGEFDMNAFIEELREDHIQEQIREMGL